MSNFNLGDLSSIYSILRELVSLVWCQNKRTRKIIGIVALVALLALAGWLHFASIGVIAAIITVLHFTAQPEVRFLINVAVNLSSLYRKNLANRQKLLDTEKEN